MEAEANVETVSAFFVRSGRRPGFGLGGADADAATSSG
jgi:hypothetical protein